MKLELPSFGCEWTQDFEHPRVLETDAEVEQMNLFGHLFCNGQEWKLGDSCYWSKSPLRQL